MAEVVGQDGELFARLIDPLHLLRCAKVAARGKRRKPDVAAFLVDQERECLLLARELESGAYATGPYMAFWIRDPKPRLISAAPFRDRVLHQALVSIAEPLFERRFIAHSYACRVGKGTHRALYRGHALAQRRPFVLKGDVVKFFPSMDHGIAKQALRRVIADRRFLAVFDGVIDASNEQEPITPHWFPGDDLETPYVRRKGLPIGNLTSQFLANVVLDRLDHFICDDLGYGEYVRYCDDFLVFGASREGLWEVRRAVVEELGRLRLRLHDRKGGVIGTRSPVPFLGFVLHGARRRLQRQAVVRADRRLRRRAAEVTVGRRTVAELQASIRSWAAHAAHGHGQAIVRKVVGRLRVGCPPAR